MFDCKDDHGFPESDALATVARVRKCIIAPKSKEGPMLLMAANRCLFINIFPADGSLVVKG